VPEPSQVAAADRIEKVVRRLHRLLWVMAPVWAIVAIDLFTGWPIGEWRIDVPVLATLPFEVWSLFVLKRTIRKMRQGEYTAKATPAAWARAIASNVATVAIVFSFGYLVRGWFGGLLLASSSVVVAGASIGFGLLLRRRRQRASTTRGA
jgi:hypothetical protein